MTNTILVTYGSKYGATKEIAGKIADVIRNAGFQTNVLPAGDVKDLSPYHAVILGSALYVGKWHKEAESFLKANEKALVERPVWIFSSGPTGNGDPVELVEGKRLPSDLIPIVNRIHPLDVTVFHGNIDLQKVNAIEKWAVKSVVKKPFGDFRNWDAIIAWADQIAAALKNPEPQKTQG